MGSRYYNPMLGRFLSIDPIEPDENNLHSLNRYAYANNNPYKFVDPDGQAAETVIDVISLGLSIQAYRQDPSFVNALAVAYDGLATAVPVLPGGLGILRQASSKGGEITQAVRQAADGGAARAGATGRQTTVLGENMMERVIPFAEKTGGRTLPFSTTPDAWAKLTPKERWKLNDGSLRTRIREGDSFQSIGRDPFRDPAIRQKFDFTGAEFLRLKDRGIPVETVAPSKVRSTIGRP